MQNYLGDIKKFDINKIINNDKYREPVIDFLQSIVVAISICIVIYLFIAMPNKIEGESMEPNFYNGEIILTNKLSKWFNDTVIGDKLNLEYERGDVIVFQKPNHDDFIKRIIGLPGDEVNIKEGKVYINGEQLNELGYLNKSVQTPGGAFIEEGESSREVPQGHYFVLGDNRTRSHDSRTVDIGFVKEDWIKGKVILRYWPIDTFKVIRAKGLYKSE